MFSEFTSTALDVTYKLVFRDSSDYLIQTPEPIKLMELVFDYEGTKAKGEDPIIMETIAEEILAISYKEDTLILCVCDEDKKYSARARNVLFRKKIKESDKDFIAYNIEIITSPTEVDYMFVLCPSRQYGKKNQLQLNFNNLVNTVVRNKKAISTQKLSE